MGEIVKATVVQKPFVACPTCGEAGFSVGHLKPEGDRAYVAGPWYCDSCGWGIKLSSVGGELAVEKLAERMWTSAVKLVIPPQKLPIELIVKGMAWDEKDGARVGAMDGDGGDRYLYEEHNCSENWMRDVVQVKVGDDHDPHGLAKYVSTKVLGPGNMRLGGDDVSWDEPSVPTAPTAIDKPVEKYPPERVGEILERYPRAIAEAEAKDRAEAAELEELGELHGPEKCPRGACSDCDGYHHFSDLIVSFANEEAADRLDAGADAEPIHEAEKLGLEIWFPCKHDCGAWRG